VEPTWTLQDLVSEVATRIAALPAPRNGQVRAIPDDRTVRYYATIGLLDRPSVMRGRTALYGKKHVAQVVAIKRLQAMGRSLAEIQTLWPTLDDRTLARMSGVELPAAGKAPVRAEFWKREAKPSGGGTAQGTAGEPGDAIEDAGAGAGSALPAMPMALDVVPGTPVVGVVVPVAAAAAAAPQMAGASAPAAVELRLELAPHVMLLLSVVDESVAISPADVRALRAAAAPLLAELASRRLASHARGEEP
jgi:DNA-binding transcriptional MerR regulator